MTLDDARRLAEQQRVRRREVLATITRGDLAPSAFGGEDGLDPVKVVAVAEVVPGVGKVRARRILAALGIAEGTRWADLGPDGQRRLAAAPSEAVADRPPPGAGAPPAGGR
jgi:S13-like H2TH domain